MLPNPNDPSAPIFRALATGEVGPLKPMPVRRTLDVGSMPTLRVDFRGTTPPSPWDRYRSDTPIYDALMIQRDFSRMMDTLRDGVRMQVKIIGKAAQRALVAMCPLPTGSEAVLSAHLREAGDEGRAIVRSGMQDVLLWLGEKP